MRRALCAAAAGILLAAGSAGSHDAPAVLDALFPAGRRTEDLRALARRSALASGEDFKVVEVARDGATSHHVVWIRDREQPHRHDHHDLIVVIVEGHGRMRLGGAERVVGEGSILYVPRGTPHAFHNEPGPPAAAYAIYVPPFDGKDRVPVD